MSSSSESCPSADELCPSSDSKRRVRDSAIQIELKRKKIEVEELQRALAKKNGNGSKEDPLAKELETMSSELAKLRAKLRTYKMSEQHAISDPEELREDAGVRRRRMSAARVTDRDGVAKSPPNIEKAGEENHHFEKRGVDEQR